MLGAVRKYHQEETKKTLHRREEGLLGSVQGMYPVNIRHHMFLVLGCTGGPLLPPPGPPTKARITWMAEQTSGGPQDFNQREFILSPVGSYLLPMRYDAHPDFPQGPPGPQASAGR